MTREFPRTAEVHFDSNDFHGNPRGSFDAIEIVARIDGEEASVTLEHFGSRQPAVEFLQRAVKVDSHSFRIEPGSRRCHVGNLCWDSVTLLFGQAMVLARYLLELGWEPTGGTNDDVFAGLTVLEPPGAA